MLTTIILNFLKETNHLSPEINTQEGLQRLTLIRFMDDEDLNKTELGRKRIHIKKLLIELEKYAEAKWNEAIKATQDSICEDCSTPPKFKP